MEATFRRCAVALALASVVLGCAVPPSPRPTSTFGTLLLPTLDTRGNFPCAGVGTVAELTGDPNDPRVAWVVSSGKRLDVVFPYGFSARFAPDLEVLDATGVVVARAGDRIDEGCVTGGPMLILLP
jgi:hypothetical protein